MAVKLERNANTPCLTPGFSMHMAAILAWSLSSSVTEWPEILRKALANAPGLRVVYAAVESARYSRWRETAKRISGAII